MVDKYNITNTSPPPFEGSLGSAPDVERAARGIVEGQVWAIDNGCVFAECFNGADPAAVQATYDIKDRPTTQTFGLTGTTEWFLDIVDADKVDPDIQGLLLNPDELQLRTSGLFFVRAPIKEELKGFLPNEFVSLDGKTSLHLVQNYDPSGKYHFSRLIERATAYAAEQGIPYLPGVTSHNVSGSPQGEIIDPVQATDLAREKGLPILIDPDARRNGTSSYGIINFTPDGLFLARGGSISDEYATELFRGYALEKDASYRAPKHSPLPVDAIPHQADSYEEIRQLPIRQIKDLLLWMMQ